LNVLATVLESRTPPPPVPLRIAVFHSLKLVTIFGAYTLLRALPMTQLVLELNLRLRPTSNLNNVSALVFFTQVETFVSYLGSSSSCRASTSNLIFVFVFVLAFSNVNFQLNVCLRLSVSSIGRAGVVWFQYLKASPLPPAPLFTS